jgi:hypothetical protein
MSILEQVREYEKLGIKIVPVVTGDKKPVTKHIGNFDSQGKPLYEWKNVAWTEEDYIKADAGGIIHDQSNIIDIDFDDVSSIKFQRLLPETMTIGKRVNDTLIPTHMFYRYEGKKDKLVLGNLDSYRDWGHSKDYVKAMNLITNHSVPDDFVVATGKTHSVRDLCNVTFDYLNLDYKKYIVQDDKFRRPEELNYLCGDSTKTREILGWEPEYTFEVMIKEMVDYWSEKV